MDEVTTATNAIPDTGLARVKDLRSAIKALMRHTPIPGIGLEGMEVPDGVALTPTAGSGENGGGEFAVTVSGGGLVVTPGTIRVSGGGQSPVLSSFWEGTPNWGSGQPTTTPVLVDGGAYVVAIRCTSDFVLSRVFGVFPPTQAPRVEVLPWPMPDRILDGPATDRAVWHVPLALVVANRVYQLTHGPLRSTAQGPFVFTGRADFAP